MKNLGLKWKILIPLILIIFATFLEIGLIVSMNRAQQVSATQVNIAGRQRMLSQKMSKEMIGAAFTGSQEYRESLNKTVETFESSLKALQAGGSLQVSGREVTVEKTTSKEIITQLQETATYWNSVRPLVDQARSGQLQASPEKADEINKELMGVLERFDRITGMYENVNSDKIRRSMAVIYACLAGFFALTVFTWYITNRYIIRPITVLKESANEIARGNLASEINI
ncbi:MAG: type IV pili methyl-accepting chemotaxis transducer N-terminal domain-containing protein [Firmicutes bacterium]|nr:type IV pili methyl-accepting chemotaxis transducer N-terminal domain-containing protein [Bacillota bacterium]